MAVITIGQTVSNRNSSANFSNSTTIYKGTANATGKIDTFNIYVNTEMPNLKIGVFYESGGQFTCRSYTTIGTATAGSKSYTGLDLDVVEGDYIGTYWSTGGKIEADSTSGDYWYKSGDNFTNGAQSYTFNDSGGYNNAFSVNGTGETVGTAYTLAIELGQYTYTGVNFLLKAALKMAITTGSYTYTGIDYLFKLGKGMMITTGNYAYTGVNFTLKSARSMAITTGSYVYSGIDFLLKKGFGMVISTGSYIYTGFNFILRSSNIWTNQTKNTSTFTNQSKNTSNWSNESKNDSNWTNQNKS